MASSAETSARTRAELSGRRAVVAGASGGIGHAVARALAEAGAHVWMVARRADRLEAAAAAVRGEAVTADVAVPDEVERLRARIERDGPADILVNAAGAFDLAPVAETTPAMFDRMIGTNLGAPFLLIRAFLPGMLSAGRGHVVTIGSIAGRRAFPHNGAYAASKFGVRGLHAVLDEELKGTGVRATLIEPAATDTEQWDAFDPAAHPGLPPRSDMLPPEAVADAVLYAVTRPADVEIPFLALERS